MSDRYITRYVNLTNFHYEMIVDNVESSQIGRSWLFRLPYAKS